MLESADIAAAVARMDAAMPGIRDALNAADRQLGDGDTGMTIAQVVAAWRTACAELPSDVGEALVALGRETRKTSGSTLGSVIAIGLAAAGRTGRGRKAIDRDALVAMLAAAASAIGERSGAAVGDKTVLDALLRIEGELSVADDGAGLLEPAVQGAQAALDSFRDRESRAGRARIYGAKSAGHDDPGMLAALLLLQAAR